MRGGSYRKNEDRSDPPHVHRKYYEARGADERHDRYGQGHD